MLPRRISSGSALATLLFTAITALSPVRPPHHSAPRRAPALRSEPVEVDIDIDFDAEAPPPPDVAALTTAEEMIASDPEGPPPTFDWDAHLARIEAEAQAERADALEEERVARAGAAFNA